MELHQFPFHSLATFFSLHVLRLVALASVIFVSYPDYLIVNNEWGEDLSKEIHALLSSSATKPNVKVLSSSLLLQIKTHGRELIKSMEERSEWEQKDKRIWVIYEKIPKELSLEIIGKMAKNFSN